MSETRVIVLPYRYGDVFNALPIARQWALAGHDVRWVIHEEFADLFDGVSYAKPIVYKGKVNDVKAAIDVGRAAVAQEGKEARIYPLKSGSYSPPIPRPLEHFTAELWARAGALEHYHTWPLVIDRRVPTREAALVDEFIPATLKPVLGYCFRGHSFKYAAGETMAAWLAEENDRRWQPWDLVNLADIRAYRIYDMLGVLERLDCLFSVDTSLVHLARASGVPTAVIIPERDYDSPEPQRHWIGAVRGGESITEAVRARLTQWLFDWSQAERLRRRGYLCRDTARMYAKPILFGVAAPERELTLDEQNAAKISYLDARMRDRYWIEADVLFPTSHLGEEATIDLLLAMSPRGGADCPCKYIALAKAGTCLAADAPHVLRRAVALGAPAAYSPAVASPGGAATSTQLAARPPAPGGGVVMFDIGWWRERKFTLPRPLDWGGLYAACRQSGAPCAAPAAYLAA